MMKEYQGHQYEVILDPAVRVQHLPLEQQESSYRVWLDGKLLPCEWNSAGAADAGAQVEIRRIENRKMRA